MTFFPKIQTTPADGINVDAFARQRVGLPETIFDSKQILSGQPLLWAIQALSGSSVAWQSGRSSTFLTVTSSVGSKAVRQTRRRFNYQPGKSLLISHTFIMGSAVPGIRKDVGYFDEGNGIFFQQSDSGSLGIVKRSSVSGAAVDTIVSQSLWNLDKLDGTGPSGFRLDISKAQILSIDMQWLGAGRVRCGFFFSGTLVNFHQFNHANEVTSVYMTSPNLPVRASMTCTSGSVNNSATLEQICTSVISEGGYDPKGLIFSADRGVSVQSGVDAGALYPVLSLRMRSGSLSTNVMLEHLHVLCTTNANFRWALLLNPVVNGSDAASWVGVNSSSLEYDVSRTTTNSLSGGIQLDSGYGNTATDAVTAAVESSFAFGAEVDGTRDQIVLGVTSVQGSNSYLASISWKELVA